VTCRYVAFRTVARHSTWWPALDRPLGRPSDGEVVAALSVVVGAGSVDLRTVRPAVIASGLAVSRRLGWHPSAGVRQVAP
jgi:hypothetical protein